MDTSHTNWRWTKIVGFKKGRTNKVRRSLRKGGRRLHIERCEDRHMLTPFLVSNTSDGQVQALDNCPEVFGKRFSMQKTHKVLTPFVSIQPYSAREQVRQSR